MFTKLSHKAGLALAALTTIASASASAAVATYTDFDAFQSAATGLITDSFDAAPWIPVGVKAQGFSNLGVTWTAGNSLYTTNNSRSGSFAITSLDPGTVGDEFDWLTAVLPANVTAVGGWITSFGQAHLTELMAFDAFDNVLGSVSVGTTGNGNFAFIGLTTDIEVARVLFRSTNVTNPIGDDFNLDDFTFGTTSVSPGPIAVPEPAAMALFGTGALAAFCGHRRRRRAGRGSAARLDARLLADIGIGRGEILARELGLNR
jgi:uncharacterized protein YjiS (DUF1127 family)